jgi:hypothetical protein
VKLEDNVITGEPASLPDEEDLAAETGNHHSGNWSELSLVFCINGWIFPERFPTSRCRL